MSDDLGVLTRRIDGNRMRELLVDFANLRLAAGSAVATAEWYAGLLRASGAVEARVHSRNLDAPMVVAGFPGTHRAPTLQFMGYMSANQPEPMRTFAADGYVYGPDITSGAAGLIAAAEMARVLAGHGPMPGGGLLFTARILHDRSDAAPDIVRLINMGIAGQAVVITSGSATMLPVMGQGTCRFEVRFVIPEPEPPSADCRYTAIDAAHAFCGVLRRRHIAAGVSGAESVVVGSMGGGDRYDGMARSSWIKGAWRFGLDRTEADVRDELERIARRVAVVCGAQAALTVEVLRAPYRLDGTTPLVDDLSAAYRVVWGSELPPGCCSLPSDVPLFLGRGIPAVCHGPLPAKGGRADATACVSIEDLVRLAEVYVRLTLSYLYRRAVTAGAKNTSEDAKIAGDKTAGDKVALGTARVSAR